MLLSDNKQLKAAALARLKHRVPPEDVAAELNIPLNLVREWESSLTTKDYASAEGLQLGPQALIAQVTTALSEGSLTLDKVRDGLENAALKIATEVSTVSLIAFDIERARTVNLLASSIATLQNAFFNKNQTVNLNYNQASAGEGLSRFTQRD